MAAQEASGRSAEPSPCGLLPESLEDPAEGESARQDQVCVTFGKLGLSLFLVSNTRIQTLCLPVPRFVHRRVRPPVLHHPRGNNSDSIL